MVHKTYISKFNTIISGCKFNTSLNPVSDIVYGKGLVHSRALIYFDHEEIKKLIDGGIMPNKKKMTHTLHITNAGSLDFTMLHACDTSDINDNKRIRALSFDLIFFLIPKTWDRGRGFDYKRSYFNVDFYSKNQIDPNRLISEDGCTWYQRRNGLPWDEEGVYSTDTLSKEYDKFSDGEESKVIGRLRFEVGNEDIELDITEIVNKFIDGVLENNGIGIAYSPMYEMSDSEFENYLGLVTDKTNTWFAPYVETRYNDSISDDRSNFVMGKDNKLYLYCTIGDTLDDLDEEPTVSIVDGNDEYVIDAEGNELVDVKAERYSKGVYYIPFALPIGSYEPETMLYDTWGNIKYKGSELPNVELDFTVKPTNAFFNIGKSLPDTISFTPSLSGIQEKERIQRGDIRKIVISPRPNYTTDLYQLIDDMDVRVYVMDGEAEVDFISWDKVEKTFLENYYVIDTNIFLPQRYHVDVRIKYGMNSIIHHDVLTFDIINDKTNKYA